MSIQEIAKGVFVIKPNERKKWQDSNAGKYVSLFTKNRAEQWELSLKQATEDIKSAQERYEVEMELYKSRLLQLDKEAAAVEELIVDKNVDVQKFNATQKQKAETSTKQLQQDASQYRSGRQERLGVKEFQAESAPVKGEKDYAKGLDKAYDDRLRALQAQFRFNAEKGYAQTLKAFPDSLTEDQKKIAKSEYDATLASKPIDFAPSAPLSEEEIQEGMAKHRDLSREDVIDTLQKDKAPPREVEPLPAGVDPDLYEYVLLPNGRRVLKIRGDLAEGISSGRIKPETISELAPEVVSALRDQLAARRAELVAPTAPAPDLIGQARSIFGSKFGGRVSTGTLADQLLAMPPELRDTLLARYRASQVAPTEVAPSPAPAAPPASVARPALPVTPPLEDAEVELTGAARAFPPGNTFEPKQVDRRMGEGEGVVFSREKGTEGQQEGLRRISERKAAENKKKQFEYLKLRTDEATALSRDPSLLAREIKRPGGLLAQNLWRAGKATGQTYDDLYRQITATVKDINQRNRAHTLIIAFDKIEDDSKNPPTGKE